MVPLDKVVHLEQTEPQVLVAQQEHQLNQAHQVHLVLQVQLVLQAQ